MTRHAAIDLGASSGRVVVGDIGPGHLVLTEVHRFPNGPVDFADGIHWDITALHRQSLQGLERAGQLETVGIDSWAVDYGLLDSDAQLLHQPWHYRDQRTAAVIPRVHARVPPAELYAINGLQHLFFNTIYQLAADDLRRADTLLLIPDLIAFWMTGQAGTEVTNASTTGLLDVQTRTWSTPLLQALDIPLGLMAPLRRPGEVIGQCTYGMLVAVGSHDTASAVAAVPMDSDRAAYISLGTWGLVGVELEHPVLTEESRSANFTNELGVDDRIRFLRNVMGLWLLQESMRCWGLSDVHLPELLTQAALVPPQPVFDVDDPRLATPGDMPGRLEEVIAEQGHRPPADRVHLVRQIMDSLAAALAAAVRSAGHLSGRDIEVIHVVGGGAQNSLLCQLLAEAAGLPVVAGPVEATALGNVLVQARAHGTVSGDLEQLRALVRRHQPLRRHDP